jgi:Skp family chaperone for outer membrane proteins
MMKFLRFRAVSAGLALALLLAAAPVLAQQQPAPRPAQPAQPAAPQRPAAQPVAPQALPPKGTFVVILDNTAVEREGKAFQSVRAQHDRVLQAQQTDVTKMENDLRAADQDLAKQRTVLSPEAYGDRRRDLERRFTDAQQLVQNRRRDIDQAAGDAYNKVVGAMLEVVAGLAQDNDYKVVLSRAQVIVSEKMLDITGEVIQRLDKKLPTMAVSVPAAKR